MYYRVQATCDGSPAPFSPTTASEALVNNPQITANTPATRLWVRVQ